MNQIKVLIADDSALMRKLLTEILSADPAIQVVGAVSDAYKAREEIKRLNPDVLTLDIEMPKMDGISFLERLMRLRPMPVVMISAMTEKGADITMKALMLGAVDFISKPKIDIRNNLAQYSNLIREKVKTAAASQLNRSAEPGRANPKRKLSKSNSVDLISIGASTGGVEAIHTLLRELPTGLPPIVITQHIPPVFSASFANQLNNELSLEVTEAADGMRLLTGYVYIAPGDQHLVVTHNGENYVSELNNQEPVNRHKPSVEVLFNSVARHAAKKAIGILLTGMGDDGASGLLRMKEAGATTIAQDKASSIVWGMPREAIELGAADYILPLNLIPPKIITLCEQTTKGGAQRGITRPQPGTIS